MKLISWNVAGFRACLKKGFDDFFKDVNADVFCMQEAKVTEDQFDYRPEGYEMYLYPAEKKGYSGTLVYSKVKPISITYGLGIEEHDHEGRVITMEFDKFYLINEFLKPHNTLEIVVWEKDRNVKSAWGFKSDMKNVKIILGTQKMCQLFK